MNQETKALGRSAKAFFLSMAVLFILLQWGFHQSYIQYFPTFQNFNWLHHAHGAIMVSWLVLLIIQPYLIHKGKYAAHRTIGKISYITAPLMLVSMFLATRQNYLTTVDKLPFRDVAYIQALNFMAPVTFLIFYTLAIVNKNNPYKHQRYMIGTAFVMIIAIVSRIFQHSFPSIVKDPYDYFIPLYFCLAAAALLLIADARKGKCVIPYTIVTVVVLLNVLVFHSRYTDLWTFIVKYVGDAIFKS